MNLCLGARSFLLLSILAAACMPANGSKEGASKNRLHLSAMAWTKADWQKRCTGVRTSFNPTADLGDEVLTLVPGDERWLDFVYWAINNKLAEHQVEAYGGTGWNGPTGGVIFHWAPGSHWERDTLASFGFTIGHTIGEHRWLDTMFPDFFEKYGGVYGVNVKDRLAEIDPASPKPWVEFLEYSGGSKSPYYRYLFHQEAVVDPEHRRINLIGGHGVAFAYSFERYYHELREVLTDCRAVDFFEMYDRFGPGFAATGNWAHQNPPAEVVGAVGYASEAQVAKSTAGARYNPMVAAVDVPADLPEADAMKRGKDVYLAQCAMCHGIKGDGAGFLAAGFETKPRDFTTGTYKFRSTQAGELPTMADVERTVRVGVPETTMPAWGQFLSPQQIADVSRYLVVFSPRFVEAWKAKEVPEPLVVASVPHDLSKRVDRGAVVWKDMQCAACHGDLGRGDGTSASSLKDDHEFPIQPANLTYKWTFKAGFAPEDVYRTLMGGLSGTPMPSYASAIETEDDRWALVAYTLSLSPEDRPVLRVKEYRERRARISNEGHVLPRTTAVGSVP
jgi:mono/diheme cytochrome c family protein